MFTHIQVPIHSHESCKTGRKQSHNRNKVATQLSVGVVLIRVHSSRMLGANTSTGKGDSAKINTVHVFAVEKLNRIYGIICQLSKCDDGEAHNIYLG